MLLFCSDQPHKPYVRKCFVHRMALAKLTPQRAAAWRHDMPPSTAFSGGGFGRLEPERERKPTGTIDNSPGGTLLHW
jgi:hypothetical protein